jgi:hypothetical protein
MTEIFGLVKARDTNEIVTDRITYRNVLVMRRTRLFTYKNGDKSASVEYEVIVERPGAAGAFRQTLKEHEFDELRLAFEALAAMPKPETKA